MGYTNHTMNLQCSVPCSALLETTMQRCVFLSECIPKSELFLCNFCCSATTGIKKRLNENCIKFCFKSNRDGLNVALVNMNPKFKSKFRSQILNSEFEFWNLHYSSSNTCTESKQV